MCIIDFFSFAEGCVLSTSEALMVDHLAFVAIRNTAARAVVTSHLLFISTGKEVIAVVSGAIEVVSRVAALPDHFPFESLQSGKFLLVQELLEVVYS